MKYLIKFFIMMAVLCTVTACSQAFEDVSNNKKKQETTKGRLVMKVGSKSRTILPDISIVESDIKTARLTANGTEIKSWSGSGIIEQIENEDDILLDVGIYDFEMTFCNENGNVFLIGTIDNKEIKAGDNSLIFNMKLSQGNGNIAIGLSWEADCKISKIKAGLYDIATGEAVAGYEAEEIVINGTVAGYIKENVPSGQYIIKFELYDAADQLLNTLTEVIKVTVGKTTTEQKVLSNINTLYTITYNLNGGSWKSGFIPITLHNTNTEINLPTADNVEKTNYALIGWYDENGNKVTQIPSNTAKDITMTAKWGYTANTVGAVIKALSGTGPHDITVTGAITSDTISAIKTALGNNRYAKVNLDLSDTTGLTSINDSAFYNCSSLTSVIIPDSVTSIGSSAFSGCSSLTSVTIPDSVTSIGSSAFSGCDSLKSVTIPDSVTSIGKGAFSGCDNLEITINTDDKYLYSEDGTTILLCDSSVTSVIIPENVASINSGAFACCRNVETIETGDTLMSLSYLPITSAKSITIGNGVTSIGQQAFRECSKLTSVTIGNGVTYIDSSAFGNCSSLTTVNYKGTQEQWEQISIRSDNTYLTNATINYNYTGSVLGKVTAIFVNSTSHKTSYKVGESLDISGLIIKVTKSNGSIENVYVTSSMVSGFDSSVVGTQTLTITYGGCTTTFDVEVHEIETETVEATASNVYDKVSGLSSGYYLLKLSGEITSSTIADITSAMEYTSAKINLDLSDTTGLTSTGSGTSGSRAFWYCDNLISITLPAGLTSIGNDAFTGCNNLINVVIPESVTEIGHDAFKSCSKLINAEIPEGVTTINEQTFAYCSSLTSVTIPASVTYIDYSAFEDCNSLTTVNYRGTQEQWEQISIGSDNTYLTNATINYNYTGE